MAPDDPIGRTYFSGSGRRLRSQYDPCACPAEGEITEESASLHARSCLRFRRHHAWTASVLAFPLRHYIGIAGTPAGDLKGLWLGCGCEAAVAKAVVAIDVYEHARQCATFRAAHPVLSLSDAERTGVCRNASVSAELAHDFEERSGLVAGEWRTTHRVCRRCGSPAPLMGRFNGLLEFIRSDGAGPVENAP